jgi:outer membrane receptor for ferrienterochelin and colicin
LFLEDEIKVSEKLRLTVGGRYDYHPLVGGRFSPRGNIYYSLSKNKNREHILRFSAAKAFRNPSFMDSYMFIEEQLKRSLPPPLPPLELPLAVITRGNPDLKAEGITAVEMGYHFAPVNGLKLKVNLFYNRYVDFIGRTRVNVYYEQNEIFPGSPGGVIPKMLVSSIQNGGDARGVGGEIQLDYSSAKQVSAFVNYSFEQITDAEDDPATAVVNEKDRVRPEYPKHKLNTGLRLLFKNGISVNLLAHWVDQTTRLIPDSLGNSYLAVVDDYFILNTRVGVVFWREKGELALSVFNLLNDEHYQFPTQENLAVPLSSLIGRRITLTLRLKF